MMETHAQCRRAWSARLRQIRHSEHRLRLKIIIPALMVPLLAVGALFSGVLPVSGADLPFIGGAAEVVNDAIDTIEETLGVDEGDGTAKDAEVSDDVPVDGDAPTEDSVGAPLT